MDKIITGFNFIKKPFQYKAVSSKSYTHRYMICAAMARGVSEIKNSSLCEDTLATAFALKEFGIGVDIDEEKKIITIRSKSGMTVPEKPVFCNESGSTLRFMIPQALHFGELIKYSAGELLSKRPIDSFSELFKKNKIKYDFDNGFPISVNGELSAGDYEIPADISSQFASGLIMLLASKKGESNIKLTGKIESLDYIKMTIDVLKDFGVDIDIEKSTIKIKSNGRLNSGNYYVEGDYSQAAFFIAIGILSNGIELSNIKLKTSQADRRILKAIENMGVRVERMGGMLRIYPTRPKACVFDVSECPDIAPPIALLMALASGKSKITGAKRLRYKETDRLSNIAEELNKIGGNVKVEKDSLIIDGVESLKGGKADSHGDHRIAMMLSAAITRCTGEIIISNSESVGKSYPDFFEDFKKVGGLINE